MAAVSNFSSCAASSSGADCISAEAMTEFAAFNRKHRLNPDDEITTGQGEYVAY